MLAMFDVSKLRVYVRSAPIIRAPSCACKDALIMFLLDLFFPSRSGETTAVWDRCFFRWLVESSYCIPPAPFVRCIFLSKLAFVDSKPVVKGNDLSGAPLLVLVGSPPLLKHRIYDERYLVEVNWWTPGRAVFIICMWLPYDLRISLLIGVSACWSVTGDISVNLCPWFISSGLMPRIL